jgi:uracil-DNA glycosylase
MDEAKRLEYLAVMGIESWQLRYSPSVVAFAEPLPTHQSIEVTLEESPPVIPVPESDLATSFEPVAFEAVITESVSKAPAPPIPAIPVAENPVTIPADNWEILRTEVSQCRKCALCQTRTQTVFGTGNQQPEWLFIGEAPGEQEDLQGQPFVGVAGTLLTEMIRALGLDREQVFIANILKCRPPGNRDPHVNEASACRPFLDRQIALLQPKIIVAVGRIATQQLLNSQNTIGKLRGQVHQLNGIPLIAVYHPAYLLRSLTQKRKAWQDLQLALKTYQDMTRSFHV